MTAPALYQEVILDHYRRPRNMGRLADGAQQADGNNPLCGDRITVYVRVSQPTAPGAVLEDSVLIDATFEGTGCAISVASASLMTEAVRGKTIGEADRLSERVHDLITATPGAPVDDLGALTALSGVRQFPVRAKCAYLPWLTLRAAVHKNETPVSTE